MTEIQTVPTHWLGFCDTCRAAKTFPTARERELWLKYHPHEEEGE
jgi:hypothetical protein